jgi:hypothetical protein
VLTFSGGTGATTGDAFELEAAEVRVRRPNAMARCRRACKESVLCSGDVADDVDLMDSSGLSVAGI